MFRKSDLCVCLIVITLVSSCLTEEHKNLIDLSHNLNSETLHWLTARPFELRVEQNGTIRRGDEEYWVQSDEIHMASHTGTHIDAPCHFSRGKWCVSDIPFSHLIDIPIAVVDVSQKCLENRDYEATIDDVKEWELKHGQIPDKAVLVIQTGWSRWWPSKKQYFGTEGTDPALAHFPGVHPNLSQWLVENRNIVGLGVDGPSVDNGQSKSKKTHRIMGARNIYNIENMASRVFDLPPIGAKMIALPLKLDGASGTPVTIVAYLSKDSDHSHSGGIKNTNMMIGGNKLLSLILYFIISGFVFH